MKCRELNELLGAYADGELEKRQAREVEAHLASCPGCAQALSRQRALSGSLREAILEPAERAAAEGRFDTIWANVESAIAAPPPSLGERLVAWWSAGRSARSRWAPALAAAAVLVVVAGLWAARSGVFAPEGDRLADALTTELPPFAAPRLSDEPVSVARETSGDEVSPGLPTPRRRGPEGMVAVNEVFIVDYEVERGTVIVEHNPEEPNMPVVVWHLFNGDEQNGGEESI